MSGRTGDGAVGAADGETDSLSRVDRLIAEGLLGLAAVAPLAGRYRDGRPCHPSTVARWCQKGVRTPDNQVIRLEHIRIGGRLMTSRQALLRFVVAQSAGRDVDPPVVRTPAARKAAAEQAAIELSRAGL